MGMGSPLLVFKVVTSASRRIGSVARLMDGSKGTIGSLFGGSEHTPVSGSQTGSVADVMKRLSLSAERTKGDCAYL